MRQRQRTSATLNIVKSDTSYLNADSIFLQATSYGSGGYDADSIAVLDVNRDGKADLLVANMCVSADSNGNCTGSGEAAVRLGNGDGTFQPPITYGSGGYNADFIAVADVNRDGRPDLLVANACAGSDCSNGSVGVLLGNGDGTFQPAAAYASGGYSADFIAIADVNGDGKPDLLVANDSTPGEVGVLLGNGDGTFQAALIYGSGSDHAQSIAVRDVNGDGKPDIVVANRCNNCTNGIVAVLLGNGDGTFQAPVNYDSGGYDAYSVAVADVNGDGKPDMIVANQDSDEFIQYYWEPFTSGSVGVLLGNGDGTFQPAVPYSLLGHDAQSVSVVDLNGDGKLDLVVANACASGTPCSTIGGVDVLLGNGDGTFQPAATFDTGGDLAGSAALGDVNGDGKLDLVIANKCPSEFECSDGALGVLLGKGDGTFLAARTYDSGGYDPDSIVVADLNGDGKPDLLLLDWCSSRILFDDTCSASSVGVVLGNGDGTFQPAVTYGSGGDYALFLAAADINGDGKLDLLVANSCSGKFCLGDTRGLVGVLLGNGDGTFQQAVTYFSGGEGAASIAVGDVNGDGKPDILVTNDSGIGVLLGNGDGTFQQAVVYGPGGNGSDSIALADVNGDGKLDAMVSNFDSGSVGVLLGKGDGTFQPAVAYPSGGGTAISVADMNGDGKLDLVVGDNIGVLLGNGDGTFQPVIITTGLGTGVSITNQLAIADFDGDGKLDVVSPGGDFLLLGNGDGTFQSPLLLGSGPAPPFAGAGGGSGIAVGDFNRDGKPDLATADGGLNVLLNIRQRLSNTTTNIASALNPSVFGRSVTFVATVASQGSGMPTGTVSFAYGSTTLCNAVTLNGGAATCTTSALPVGSDMVMVTYTGDANFSSSSASVTQMVNQASTTLTLTSSVNPSPLDSAVTFTAAVTPQNSGQASGIVTFQDGGTTVASSAVSNNSASLTTNGLAVGTHYITAVYSGDSNFTGSTSNTVSQVVTKASTTTTLASSINPSVQGKPVTFTAVVSSLAGTPTGKIKYLNGTTVLATVTLTSGSAKYTTSKLSPGPNGVTAIYEGDPNNSGSTSSVLSQVVLAATTSTLTSSTNPSDYGQTVVFTVGVSSSIGVPPDGETVTFKQGTNLLGTQAMSGGTATLSISTLAVGMKSVTAVYSGDSKLASSTSKDVNQLVRKATTSVTLASSPNPSNHGQAVTFTATVLPQFSGNPMGNVVFKDGTKTLKIVALSGGVAGFTTSTLTSGTHSISAIYNGGTGFQGSSVSLIQTVN